MKVRGNRRLISTFCFLLLLFLGISKGFANSLPAFAIHPLPPTLAALKQPGADYFDQIQSTPVGALVWSKFPILIDVEPVQNPVQNKLWQDSASIAIREWGKYLPLQPTDDRNQADIIMVRSALAPRVSRDPKTGQLNIPRARSAETRYEFYLRPVQGGKTILSHRMTIQVSPTQTAEYTTAALRHELGHALGIWGHSPRETDLMYFSQVRTPPKISQRDLNTLKRIYQQPTRLGWPLPEPQAYSSLIHWKGTEGRA